MSGVTYWKQWESISQIRNGRVQQIELTAIEIDKLAQRIPEGVNSATRLQKFLASMHPELRLRVKPNIDKDNFDWKEVVKQAEKDDDALYQAGKYPKQKGYPSSNAIQVHKGNTKGQQKNQPPQEKKWPKRQMDEKLYQERKANGTCYFCGKTGHMISQCNARKKQEENKGKGKGGNKPKYASKTIKLENSEPDTFEEYLETLHNISKPTPNMKTTMRVAGKPARSEEHTSELQSPA